MLLIDPNKRINMCDIVQHCWLRQGQEPDEEFNILMRESLNASDPEQKAFNDSVLTHMESLGLQVDNVKEVTFRIRLL
jgi:hypothetical protein